MGSIITSFHSLRFPGFVEENTTLGSYFIEREENSLIAIDDSASDARELFDAVKNDSVEEVAKRIKKNQIYFGYIPDIYYFSWEDGVLIHVLEKQSILQVAASTGSIKVIRKLINNYKIPIDVEESVKTPLMAALACNYNKIVSLLIKSKADVNRVFYDKVPLDSCLTNIKTTQLLVEAGASINYKNSQGQSLLSKRLKYDGLYKKEVACYYVLQGADLNEVNLEDQSKTTIQGLKEAFLQRKESIQNFLMSISLEESSIHILSYLFGTEQAN